MKKLLKFVTIAAIAIVLGSTLQLIVPTVVAQNYNAGIGSLRFSSGPSIPATCPRDGYFFFKNTAPKSWSYCNAGVYSIFIGSGSGAVVSVFVASCGGTANPSATLILAPFANTGVTCNIASTNTTPVPMGSAGTWRNLFVNTSAVGVNASSGVFTVRKNGSTTGITCTVGTGTTCNDITHSATFVAGDSFDIIFTTQAAETLANARVSLERF